MQAYARAALTPLASQFRSPLIDSLVTAAPAPVNATDSGQLDGIVSPSSMLASLIVAALDDQNLAVLAHRLQPHLTRSAETEVAGRVAYTVPSLATELGVSRKAVRCAIARHELRAVKRGSRWIISSDAVQAWATASDTLRRTSRAVSASAPKSAGRPQRSGFGGASSEGGAP